MAKDESGRLLSKVAKFVRNPLKDWSELDSEGTSALENGYSREMLKEMIERRQRNDFVRRREFDMLRKLRQREAAGGRDAPATPSSFNVSSTSGKTEGRALTLKKIAEIEEQMSQQWWKGRGPNGEPAPNADAVAGTATPESADMSAQHARAYADTVPGLQNPDAPGLQGSRPGSDGSIEESAIRFAHGDDAGAEAILLQTLAPDGSNVGHDDAWRALFDLYRALGDAEKFEAASTRYAQHMKVPAPAWISLPALASEVLAAQAGEESQPAPAGDADWSCPARLTREGLLGLTRALATAGPTWKLAWGALQSIEADAAGPLRALFAHWADSAVQLRFSAGDQLLDVLNKATPVNERAVDAVWWQLHMTALRVMHRADDFELLALNYCITYEVSPPPWEDPKGEFTAFDAPAGAVAVAGAAPSATTGGRGFSMQIDSASLDADPAASFAASRSQLAGELAGESLATWERLDVELAGATSMTISCAGLVRIDFVAAGTLLNWVTARDARDLRVRFVDAHRLVVALFTVIGIADHAVVAARED